MDDLREHTWGCIRTKDTWIRCHHLCHVVSGVSAQVSSLIFDSVGHLRLIAYSYLNWRLLCQIVANWNTPKSNTKTTPTCNDKTTTKTPPQMNTHPPPWTRLAIIISCCHQHQLHPRVPSLLPNAFLYFSRLKVTWHRILNKTYLKSNKCRTRHAHKHWQIMGQDTVVKNTEGFLWFTDVYCPKTSCTLNNLQPTRPNRHCSDWIRNKITSSQFKLMLPKQSNSVFLLLGIMDHWLVEVTELATLFCWCRSTIERSDSKTRTNFISSNKHAKHVKPKGATKDQLWFRVGCRNTPKKNANRKIMVLKPT